MVALDVLILTLILLTGFLGAPILAGYIMFKIERKNMSFTVRTFGTAGIVATGLGTVVHELGHLIMCIIFGHKVIRVELFRPRKFKADGILGQVTHSYNKRNFYQTLGNFFIGAGPIIFGIAVIGLLLRLLLPDVSRALMGAIASGLEDGAGFGLYFYALSKFVVALFSLANLVTIRFWVFIIISVCIAIHMSLSKADLKGCKRGIICVLMLALGLALLLTLLGADKSLAWLIGYNVFVVSFLSIGLLMSVLYLGVIYGLFKIKRHRMRMQVRKKYRTNR